MPPPPWAICLRTVALSGLSSSRFGPNVPDVSAALSVWQDPHVPANKVRPSAVLGGGAPPPPFVLVLPLPPPAVEPEPERESEPPQPAASSAAARRAGTSARRMPRGYETSVRA